MLITRSHCTLRPKWVQGMYTLCSFTVSWWWWNVSQRRLNNYWFLLGAMGGQKAWSSLSSSVVNRSRVTANSGHSAAWTQHVVLTLPWPRRSMTVSASALKQCWRTKTPTASQDQHWWQQDFKSFKRYKSMPTFWVDTKSAPLTCCNLSYFF